MKTYFLQLLFLLGFISTFLSCDKIKYEEDPEILILGRWDPIEYVTADNTRSPYSDTSHYYEFLPDSIFLLYRYETQTIETHKYWINDSTLIFGFVYEDAPILKTTMNYTFSENNSILGIYPKFSFVSVKINYKRKN